MDENAVEGFRRKLEKLEAELEARREQERPAAEQWYAIVGRAVLEHAVKDPYFGAELMRVLDRELTERRTRELFGLPVSDHPEAPEVTATEAAATEGRESFP